LESSGVKPVNSLFHKPLYASVAASGVIFSFFTRTPISIHTVEVVDKGRSIAMYHSPPKGEEEPSRHYEYLVENSMVRRMPPI
jgi:hypothetical protein